jgi:hypothetical protein
MCPSDSALNRLYTPPSSRGSGFAAGMKFGKGNYAAYVSPEHIPNMRVFPGAMINQPQSLRKISDGTSKTIMLAEVRTREPGTDSRGAWAAGLAGGSILGYDMHSKRYADVNVATARTNEPYSPHLYHGVEPGLPPNTSQSWNNSDAIRDCPDPDVAGLEGMPCRGQSDVRSSGASRSLHTGGVNIARIDGSGDFIIDDTEVHLMARMVSINDGEGLVERELP